MNKAYWTDQEFKALARMLQQQIPQRISEQVAQPNKPILTDAEISAAMRGAFPGTAQGKLSHGQQRRLHAAVLGLFGKPAEAEGVPRKTRKPRKKMEAPPVRWTDEEWRYFALALLTLFPQLDLVNNPDLKGLRIPDANQAAKVMPAGRQRTFNSLTIVLDPLRKVFRRARETQDPVFFGKAPRPAEPAPPTPEAAPAPRAPKQERPAPQEAGGSICRVHWNKAEWMEVAAELDRMAPHMKYAERGQLGAMSPSDVNYAQRVLPAERRRKTIGSMGHLRAPLLEAFKALRQKRADEAQAKLDAAKEQHAALLARAVEQATVPNPWEEAVKPLVTLLVQELTAQLTAQLLPALIAGLQQQAGLPQQQAAAASAAPAAPEARTTLRQVMRVGIVGNRNSYADELRRDFPQVAFTVIDNGSQIDSVKNCDKVIVMIKFVSHPLAEKAQKVAGERYVPLNGGLSDIKRVVSGWLADQVAQPRHAVA